MSDGPQLFIEDRLLDTISESLQQMQKGMEKLKSLNKNMDTLEDDEFVAWVTDPSTDLTTQLDLALQFKDFMKMFDPHATQFLKGVEEIQNEVRLSKKHISFFNSAMKNMTRTKECVEEVKEDKTRSEQTFKEKQLPIPNIENVSKKDLKCASTQPASSARSVMKVTTSSSTTNRLEKRKNENSPVEITVSDNSKKCSSTQPASSARSVMKSTTSSSTTNILEKRKNENSPEEITKTKAKKLDDSLSRIKIAPKSSVPSSNPASIPPQSMKSSPSIPVKDLSQKRRIESLPLQKTISTAKILDDPLSRIKIPTRSSVLSSTSQPASIPPQARKSTPSTSAKCVVQKSGVGFLPVQEAVSTAKTLDDPLSRIGNPTRSSVLSSTSPPASIPPQAMTSTPITFAKSVGQKRRIGSLPVQEASSKSEKQETPTSRVENASRSSVPSSTSQPASIPPQSMKSTPSTSAKCVMQKSGVGSLPVQEAVSTAKTLDDPLSRIEIPTRSSVLSSTSPPASIPPQATTSTPITFNFNSEKQQTPISRVENDLLSDSEKQCAMCGDIFKTTKSILEENLVNTSFMGNRPVHEPITSNVSFLNAKEPEIPISTICDIPTSSQSASNAIPRPMARISKKERRGRIEKRGKLERCYLCFRTNHTTESCLAFPTLLSRFGRIHDLQLCVDCMKHRVGVGRNPCRSPPPICLHCNGYHLTALCARISDAQRREMACNKRR